MILEVGCNFSLQSGCWSRGYSRGYSLPVHKHVCTHQHHRCIGTSPPPPHTDTHTHALTPASVPGQSRPRDAALCGVGVAAAQGLQVAAQRLLRQQRVAGTAVALTAEVGPRQPRLGEGRVVAGGRQRLGNGRAGSVAQQSTTKHYYAKKKP